MSGSILKNSGGGHIGEHIAPKLILAPIDKTATFNSLSIDRSKFNVVNWLVLVGVLAPDGLTLDLKVQDSADDSTFADLASTTQINFGAVTLAQIIGTGDGALQEFVTDLRKAERYIRLVGTMGGTPTEGEVAIAAVLGGHVEGLPQ